MTKFIRLTFVAAFFILFCQLGYTAGYLAHDGDERMQPTQHKSKMERVYTRTSLLLGKAANERSPRRALLVHNGGERMQPTQHKSKMERV